MGKRIARVWMIALSASLCCAIGTTAASQAFPADLERLPTPTEPVEPALPERQPPRALHVPVLILPRELAATGELEVLLTIGSDGFAQLAECDYPLGICDALRAALIEAEFEPARVSGTAVPSRVRVRFQVERAPPSAPAPAPPAAAEPTKQPSFEYGATAHVKQPPPTAHALELAEMREVPGSFGDPFRVIDALPGVTPVFSALPYVYVRGAPPAATAYFYDDIQLPALFHLALGPAVVHAAMIGPIDFYPGVAPARYGRKTGGVIAGQAAARTIRPGLHGELELRLIDAQAYLAKPLGKRGRVEVAGRYGYPGLLSKLFEPRSVVQYWDYQARSVIPLKGGTELQLMALGSYDMIGTRKDGRVQRDLELQFHRLEARSVTRRGDLGMGYALGAGFERSGLGDDFEVSVARVTPKLWFENRVRKARLRAGADMLATVGRIENPDDDDDDDDSARPDSDPTMGGVPVYTPARPVPTERSSDPRNPIYQSAVGRNVVGAYLELTLPFAQRWELTAGLRGDIWLTGGDVQKALEPRLVLTHRPREQLAAHAAFGLAYQPSVFLLPLPGISDVALDRGLQRAIQSELGTLLTLPGSLSLDTKLYLHMYENMLSFDAIDADDIECSQDDATCEPREGFARMSAYSYGGELMLRRSYEERVSGWLSYTLSKADARSDGGRALTPSFDVRHVANLVLQWRISAKWRASLRGYAQSPRFPLAGGAETDPRKRQRLPMFFRGDLQISRLWQRSWGELRLTFDWLNFTMQREPVGWDCVDPAGATSKCQVDYLQFPITIPQLGVRGSY